MCRQNARSLTALFRTPLYMFIRRHAVGYTMDFCMSSAGTQQRAVHRRLGTGDDDGVAQKICIHTNIREPKSEAHLTVEWGCVHVKRRRYRLVAYVFRTFSVVPKRTIRVGGPPPIFSAAMRPRFEGRNTNTETIIARPPQHLNGQRSLVTYYLLTIYLLLTY